MTAGFNDTTIEVMTLGVYRHNTIARRLYEQLGFRTSVIVENSVTIDGEPWDNIEMRLPRHLGSPVTEIWLLWFTTSHVPVTV